jgi:hypothetical protein
MQEEKKSFVGRFGGDGKSKISEMAHAKRSGSTAEALDSSSSVASDKKFDPASFQSSSGAANPAKPIDLQKRAMAELIYLVKGVDAGRNAWYYVLVERNKVQLFLKALNDDIIHLEHYGKILYSAYGDEPPAEITGKLKEEYGIK